MFTFINLDPFTMKSKARTHRLPTLFIASLQAYFIFNYIAFTIVDMLVKNLLPLKLFC